MVAAGEAATKLRHRTPEESRGRGPLRLRPEPAPVPMESIPENLETLLQSLASDALKEDKNSKRVRHWAYPK